MLNMFSYKAFIFDLDGTLINSMPYHVKAWTEVCREHGIDLDPKLIYDMGGVSSRDVVMYFKEQGHDVGDVDAFVARKVELYRQNIHLVHTFPFVEEILRKGKDKGIKIAVGTGTQRINAEHILNLLKLTDLVEAVVTSEDVKNHKPHPDTFLLAAKRLDVKPQDCLVFEDGSLGIKAALAGGIDCIELLNGSIVKEYRAGECKD